MTHKEKVDGGIKGVRFVLGLEGHSVQGRCLPLWHLTFGIPSTWPPPQNHKTRLQIYKMEVLVQGIEIF